MPPQAAITAFAVTAAILLIGGAILIRLQRDRQHFRLMQIALERGVTAFPGVPAGWLISMRIGCLVLVLGIGLALSGVAFAFPPATSASAVQDVSTSPARPAALDAPAGDRAPPPGNPPPPADPRIEREHRLENQMLAARVCICAGVILCLLGIVRIVFARLERTFAEEPGALPAPPAGP